MSPWTARVPLGKPFELARITGLQGTHDPLAVPRYAQGVDVGRLLRLRGSIRGSLAVAGKEGSPFAGLALGESYARHRADLLQVLDSEDLRREVEELCPEFHDDPPASQNDPFGHRAYTDRATELLHRLGGWIDGLVEEAQIHMNAEAYAAAKLKQERGIGFRPD